MKKTFGFIVLILALMAAGCRGMGTDPASTTFSEGIHTTASDASQTTEVSETSPVTPTDGMEHTTTTAENPLTDVVSCRAGTSVIYHVDSGALHTFASAIENAVEMQTGQPEKPDYHAIICNDDGERMINFWIGEKSGCFEWQDEPGRYYLFEYESFNMIKSYFDEVITPYEASIIYPIPGDIEEIVKFPPPDISTVPGLVIGQGCFKAIGIDAMSAVFENAAGLVEILLPDDPGLTFDAAIIRSGRSFSFRYVDTLNGAVLIYGEHKDAIDFNPVEFAWEKASYGGQSVYSRVVVSASTGQTATTLYWEEGSISITLQILGAAGNTDIARYLALKPVRFHQDQKAPDRNAPLIGSQETINQLTGPGTGITFEQHRRAYFDCLQAGSLDLFKRFISGWLGHKGYYFYDMSDTGLPCARINVEFDGQTISMLFGDLEDAYMGMSYSTACPRFLDEIGPVYPASDIKDFGQADLDGFTCHYLVTQNYEKFITTIMWYDEGVCFSIFRRSNDWEILDAEKIRSLVSRVQYAEIAP